MHPWWDPSWHIHQVFLGQRIPPRREMLVGLTGVIDVRSSPCLSVGHNSQRKMRLANENRLKAHTVNRSVSGYAYSWACQNTNWRLFICTGVPAELAEGSVTNRNAYKCMRGGVIWITRSSHSLPKLARAGPADLGAKQCQVCHGWTKPEREFSMAKTF